MANLIWRGKGDKTTRNHTIDAALLAGVAVDIDYQTGRFVIATSETKSPLILTNLAFAGQGTETAYKIGDTAAAYEVSKNDEFQLRAGGNIAIGDSVAIGNNGRFVKSSSATFAIAQSAAVGGALFDAVIISPANLETKTIIEQPSTP